MRRDFSKQKHAASSSANAFEARFSHAVNHVIIQGTIAQSIWDFVFELLQLFLKKSVSSSFSDSKFPSSLSPPERYKMQSSYDLYLQ